MKIDDQTTYWLYPFHFECNDGIDAADLPSLKLTDIKQAHWSTKNDISNDEPDTECAWSPAKISLKSDLLPHLRRLLGDSEIDPCEIGALTLQPLKLTDRAIGKLGGRKFNFALSLSKRASQRLSLPFGNDTKYVIPFKINSAHLYRFCTGTGILVLETEYALPETEDGKELSIASPNLAEVILEANHVLGSPNRTTEFLWRKKYLQQANLPGFSECNGLSLFNIAETLLGGIRGRRWAAGASRIYNYTSLTVQDVKADEIRQFGFRLARRYTADYTPNVSAGNLPYEPFNNVFHFAEYEGSASIAVIDKPVEYLKDFLENTVRQTLLPMLLIATHEQNFLIDLADGSRLAYLSEPNEEKRSALLNNKREAYLSFRLHYRFDYAARLSNQNDMYRIWRKVFRGDEISAGLDDDLKKISEIELGKHQARIESNLVSTKSNQELYDRIMIALGAAVSAFFVTDKIIEKLSPGLGYSVWIDLVSALGFGLLSWNLKRKFEIDEDMADKFDDKSPT